LLPLLADRALLPPPPSESEGSDGSDAPPSPASPTSSLVYAAIGAASPAAGSGPPPFQSFAAPAGFGAALAKVLKPYPAAATAPNLPQDRWMTRALIEGAWARRVPRFSVLWLSDPAYSQGVAAPGTNAALASIQGQDENLRLLLAALERKGVRGKTDVFVVSDTGYSTVGEGIDVADELAQAGFNAVRRLKAPAPAKEGEEAPKPALARGQVLVVGHGGTVLLYVGKHDAEVTARLAAFLQRSRFAGVIFSREARDGAFTLHQANLATADWESLPDLLFSFRWTAEANRNGVPGTVSADVGGGAAPRRGATGTLSRFDLHAVLVASGPDLRSGWVDDLPSGNADLAPTIAGLVGLSSPPWMDGRVLVEAIRGYPAPAAEVRAETLEAAAGAWKQTLRLTRVGGAVYFEEGNGGGSNRGGVGAP
ncbi:MAG TPA: alkaline phosphatase family protein, partial [Candidatus Methylacidiphilales bacterium]